MCINPLIFDSKSLEYHRNRKQMSVDFSTTFQEVHDMNKKALFFWKMEVINYGL